MIFEQYGDEELLDLEGSFSFYNNNYSVWTTKTGERINLCDMKTAHILNCIRLCEQTAAIEWVDAFRNELSRRSDSKSIYKQKFRIGDSLFIIHHSDIFGVNENDIHEYIISELAENEEGIIYYNCRKRGHTGYTSNHCITRRDDVFGVSVFSTKAEAINKYLNSNRGYDEQK